MWAWRGLVKAVLCPRLSTPKPGREGAARENGLCWGGYYSGVPAAGPPACSGTSRGQARGPAPEPGLLNAGHCAPRDKAREPGSDQPHRQQAGVLACLRPAPGGPGACGGAGGQAKPPWCTASHLARVGKGVPHPHPASPILTPRPPSSPRLPPAGGRFLGCSLRDRHR